MTDFHEYVTEIVTVSDLQRIARGAITHERLRMADHMRGTQGVRTAERVTLGDATVATVTGRTVESVLLADAHRVIARIQGATVERVALQDAIRAAQGTKVVESIALFDVPQAGRSARTIEYVSMRDLLGQVGVSSNVAERIRLSDAARAFVQADTTEVVRLSDVPMGRQSVSASTLETVRLSDVIAAAKLATARTVERVNLADLVTAQYHAQARTEEVVYVDDVLPAQAGDGRAWTAHTTGWAMSRYDGYPFSRAVVVDGLAFASAQDGVYCLTGGDEVIRARLTTGKLDVGRGMLAHPLYAFAEYELDGSASMGVTQTQSGAQAQTWVYQLAAEPAEYLTNGRFVFGRGLRGRHFTFDLEVLGTKAHFNDLYVAAEATRRRV